MPDVHIYRRLSRPFPAFQDRTDAGNRLVDYMKVHNEQDSMVFALPRGGIPVAEPVSTALEAPLDLAMVRKLPVPASPEVGFGAVALDGSRLLNDRLVDHFGIQPAEIDLITEEVHQEILRRSREYLGRETLPEVRGKSVYLVDDGLATGYTMRVAAEMIAKLNPGGMVLCVPVSPWDSLATVQDYFSEIHVIYVQERPPFAVASYYRDFHDLTDHEVRDIVKTRRTAVEHTPVR